MPNRGETSAFYPGPRPDLESHGFAPEFVPTAAEQRLILFTHIIRAFGITIALVINAILFVPFLIFGILPDLFKKRFCSTPVYSPLPLTNFDGKTGRSQGIFFSHGHHRNQSLDGDVSPLLLSADTSISDFAPIEQRAINRNVQAELPNLPGPIIDFPSLVGGYVTHNGPVSKVTQLRVRITGSASNGSSNGSTKSGNSDTSEDEGLIMKNTDSVDLLNGHPKFGSGCSSGLNIPGHGQDARGNTVTKRESTWDNLQEAVYRTSKLL